MRIGSISSPLPCGFGVGRGGLGQLGPDRLPIIRSKILARYGAIRRDFDRVTALYWNLSDPRRPLPNQLRLRTNCPRQFRLTAVLRKIFFEFHADSISASLNLMQAFYKRLADSII